MALGCAVMWFPVSVRAESTRSPLRPIVALENSTASLDSFLAFLDASQSTDANARDAFKHHFFQSKSADGAPQAPSDMPPAPPAAAVPTAEPAAAPASTGSSEQEPETESSSGSDNNRSASPDPNFERWQKDAKERLQEENQLRDPPQHPLAVANPGKSVVVCEAGCRTTADEIVYIAAAVPAEAADKKFEPNSSAGDDGAAPCIAGCYDRPEPKRAVHRSRADAGSSNHGVQEASVTPAKIPAPMAGKHSEATSRVMPAAAVSLAHKVHFAQIGHNGAIVERRTYDRAKQFARRSAGKASVGHRQNVLHTWHAKVDYASPRVQRRQSLLQNRNAARNGNSWLASISFAVH